MMKMKNDKTIEALGGFGVDKDEIESKLENYERDADEILKDTEKVQELLNKVSRLCEKLGNIPIIGRMFSGVQDICMMIADYVKGDYREVPLATIATFVAALVYIVSPVDLVLDAIPGIGYLDDLTLVKFVFEAASNDIISYKRWKVQR